ncbi:MAG TPA: hypothetical protein VFQ73_15445 [Flavisolibacter sp.]|nr:hypothetical protein [Flavisolibacter sp.]
MAFSTTTVQPVAKPTNEQPADNNATAAASLLSMLVLSVYAAKKSKKEFRKLKRKFLWTAFKLKMKSLFSRRASERQLVLYILLGILALVLVFYYPIAALIVAIVGLILYLTGTI